METESFGNDFIKSYKGWIKTHHRLIDVGYNKGVERFENFELEQFRVQKSSSIQRMSVRTNKSYTVYKAKYAPSMDNFASHFISGGENTIFITNTGEFDTLLMSVDIDPDGCMAEQMVQAGNYLSKTYFNDQMIIEKSTSGRGLACYFKSNIEYVKRADVKSVLEEVSALIREDATFLDLGVKFDRVIYGIPTLWNGNTIVCRGNVVRLPYCPQGWSDLRAFQTLPSIPFSFFREMIRPIEEDNTQDEDAEVSFPLPSIPSNTAEIGRANLPSKQVEGVKVDVNDGRSKRWATYNDYVRGNERPSLEGCLKYYYDLHGYTDASHERKDRSDFKGMFAKFPQGGTKKAGHPFRKNEFIEIVEATVPAERFIKTAKRHQMTVERLADFISLKVQDAFYVKQDASLFAAASRNDTVKCSRVMKSKGIIDWTLDNQTHKLYLDLAVEFGFLAVYEEAIKPTWEADGMRIKKVNGIARVIGPSFALEALQQRWDALYRAIKPSYTLTLERKAA